MTQDEDLGTGQAFTRLLAEREELARRLTGVDQRLEQLYSGRQDEFSRRLASLEEAVRAIAEAVVPAVASAPVPVAIVPDASPAPAAAPVTPALAETSAAVPPAPDQVGASVQPAAAIPRTPQAATPSQPGAVPTDPPLSQPRIVGERAAVDALALWAGPEPGAALLGWVPRGTRVLLTEVASGRRGQVVFQNRMAWADLSWLAPVPASPAPVPAAPTLTGPAPQPAHGPATAGAPTTTPAEGSPAAPPAAAPRSAAPLAGQVGFGPPAASTRVAPVQPPVPVAAGPAAPVPTPPPVPRPPSPWQRPGFVAKVLALVGAGVTLIGVAFLLVLAAQYGYFGPEARTVSAALLGVVLLVLAVLVRRRDPRNVGAPILAATGVAAGFLSVVTATAIYGWLPPLAGAGLTAVIGLGGMVLARRWDNQAMAIVSVLGGLVLAGYVGADQPVATAALMVVTTAVTLWFERGTGWRLFPFARVLPTVLTLLWLVATSFSLDTQQLWWLAGLAVATALLGLVSALTTPAEPPGGQEIALGLLVPMVAPAALAPLALPDVAWATAALGMVGLAYAVAGFLPGTAGRLRWALVPIGAVFVVLAAFTFTHQRYLGVMTLVLATVYLSIAARVRSRVTLVVGGVLAVIGLAGWLPLLGALLSRGVAEAAGPEQVLQSLAGIAVVVLATLAVKLWLGEFEPWLIYTGWAAATAIGSVEVVLAATWAGGAAGNPEAGFQTGHALVTTIWMVLCAVFLRLGLAARHDEDVWLHLALVIAGFAVAKLFLLDLGMLDAIARVGAFLAVGLLLLFVGTRYARAWERAHGGDEDAAAPPPEP